MTIADDTPLQNLVPANSRFLSKADVGEDGLILTIADVDIEQVKQDGESVDKRVLYFNEDAKPMILNQTNAKLLAVATGAKTVKDTLGKKIVVFFDPTIAFGSQIVGGLRIKKVPAPASAPRPARGRGPAPASQDPNDELPDTF